MHSKNRSWASAPALAAWLLLALTATSWAQPEAKPGEIIVKFKDSATASERQAIENDLGMSQIRRVGMIRAEHGRVSGLTVDQAIARYRRHPKVEYIEPDYLLHASAVPNDPAFSQLWGLQNTGQTGGTPGADIRAASAWSQFTGTRDVIVSIIDTGMDYHHPDLAANAFLNVNEIPNNGVDDDHNGFVDDVRGWDFVNDDNDPIDDNGHGTHCSGTIGAVGNNALGVVGVNWQVTLLPVKFLDASGSGPTSAAVSSIAYAVQMGARVISASWGGGGQSQALQDAIAAAGQAGVLFVAAAGNWGQDTDVFPNYPSSYPLDNIIAVAATDHDDRLASFSNYGAMSVDLAAPGVDIYSTVPGGYGLLSGTSMATPHVAGAVALIFGRFPNIPALSAKNLLLSRVDLVDSLAGRVLTGGRLNAFMPIAQPDNTAPGTISDLGAPARDGKWVLLSWTATGDDGATGTATSYELRYSAAPLTDANFASGTLVPGVPAPQPAGSPQAMKVQGLAFATSYHFAIKALDEFGNASPVSNDVSVTTLAAPDVAVSPAALDADLLTGQQTTRVLTVSNAGPAELNFTIGVVSAAQPALRAAATVLGTFKLPDRTDGADETPAPGYTPSATSFTQGRAPLRGPLGIGDIRITNTFATGLRVLIVHGGGDVSEIRTLLAGFPDIAVVDEIDANTTPVSLATLTPYHSVIVANNFAFGDPIHLGDALADYADQGGGVVLTLASFISGWEVRGRLLDQGYLPFNLGSGPTSGSTLGMFDASHPIMAGVDSAFGDALGVVSLSPGAELVASWASGQPLVATKGRVVAANLLVGIGGYWMGDVPLLLHNAAHWSSNAATWLVPAPRDGVVPAGGQIGVVVAIDASDLFGGDYDASLEVRSDDPDEASVSVPVHLHVTGAPDIAMEGEPVSVESVKPYALVGGSTTHVLAVPVPPTTGGSLELVADGDYGNFGETATATAEGLGLGSVGQIGSDCIAATGSFPLSAGTLATLAADGVVQVTVQNTNLVDVFCALNQHTVRLRYSLPPDRLEFGPLFVGGEGQRTIVLRNVGTDVLHVTSIASDAAAFTVDRSSLALPPGSADTLTVTFRPTSPVPYQGTLTIASDDPDEGVLTVALSGTGLVAPDIEVAPLALHSDLLTGGQETRSVTVRNTGGSDLAFEVEVLGAPGAGVRIAPGPAAAVPVGLEPSHAAAGAAALDEQGPIVTSRAPAGYRTASTPLSRMTGARVLIVQDTQPWGTSANEQVLNGMGVAFDMIPSSSLSAWDLSAYRLVIVPSDQPTSYYSTLGALRPKLESYVTAGGVLEVHAAGWGWQGGQASLMTIPGGMLINFYGASWNQVLDAAHPLMAGIPNPFFGNSASHAFFTQIPPGATAIAADDVGRTNLVVYSIGAGTVVAGCQTFEYGFATGGHTGQILRNMIPFSYHPGPGWLAAGPASGQLPPGASAIVTVTFDAKGLNGGDYLGTVNIRSNDPDESQVPVAASLHVTGAPDLRVMGARDSVESTQSYTVPGGMTSHRLAVPASTRGDAVLVLEIDGDYGDVSETATVTVEGIRLGEVGRLGIDCAAGRGTFNILAAHLANIVADGFVDIRVQNSFDVDVFCTLNRHRVKLFYPLPTDRIDFGSLFVGLCRDRGLEVMNAGTDVLTIHELSAAGSGFSVTPASMTLRPGERDTVALRFCPPSAQPHQGTLTIRSDDPQEGVVTLALQGVGLSPPDIDVTPVAMNERLLTGEVRSRSLTIQNLGGSDLEVDLELEGGPAAVTLATRTLSRPGGPVAVDRPVAGTTAVVAAASLEQPGPVRSDQVPERFRAAAVSEVNMAGATVLIVQDAAPWGTAANETILSGRGIAYDLCSSGRLDSLDLSHYRLLIIPSDQPTSYYQRLAAQAAKLESFVNAGGVLEAHAAGWGFSGGDASLLRLPGGLRVVEYYSTWNTVLAPSHPIVAGVPSPFQGSSASHAHFTNIPLGAESLVSDEAQVPDLVVYRVGRGTVVAAGQTLEFGWVNGQSAGLILQNLLAFTFRPGPPWLDVHPDLAVVPPGSEVTITVTFDARDMFGGDYSSNLRILTNDPDEGIVNVPLGLHVTGVPDLRVDGRAVTLASTKTYASSGASTTHDLVLESAGSGTAELQVDIVGDYGDFSEAAMVYADGLPLGEVGRLGVDCMAGQGVFTISAPVFAAISADGLVRVEVRNTFAVDVFCASNQHTVALRYREPANPLEFGSPFVGTCATRILQVSNHGTDALIVTGASGSAPEFTASPASFTLAPGAVQDVEVRFCPVTPGEFAGTLTLASNDPDGDATVHLHGVGLVPPDIALGRTSASEDLMVGRSSTQPFGVANLGGSDLKVKFSVKLPAAAVAVTTSPGTAPVAASAPVDVSAVRQRYGSFAAAGAAESPVDGARLPDVATDAAYAGQGPAHGGARALAAAGGPVANVVPIFQDGFEGGSPGWTHSATGLDGLDLWAISSNRASSGRNSWHVAQHASNGADALVSPVIALQGYDDATLVFQHWYSFDDCGGDPSFEPDGGIVEVQVVGDAGWQQVHPVGGYPYTLDMTCSNPLEQRPAYAHDGQVGGAFGTATFDLTPYAGKSIRVRFHAGWDCGNCETNEGWYVDDVLVYSSSAPWLSVAPTEATIPAGGTRTFDLKFDATRLDPGVYDAELVVASNDPDEPSLTVPVQLRVANLMANVDVDPNSLNLGSHGTQITTYLELPAGHDVNGIVVPVVTLNGIPNAPHSPSVGDHDLDGVPDMMVKFSRAQVSQSLAEGDEVRVVVAGGLATGDRFLAIDRIRVMRHHVTSPAAGQVVASGTSHVVRWSAPSGWQPDHAELAYTLDGGVTWTPIATGVQGTSCTWAVPEISAREVRVRVGLFDAAGLMAYASNDGVFQIQPALAGVDGSHGPARELLLPSAPNPFVSGRSTVLAYELPGTASVNLAVYSVSGQLMRVLVDGAMPAGRHQAIWDGRDRHGRMVGAGIYFVQMRSGSFRSTRMVTMLN